MYTLIRLLPLKRVVYEQLPAMALAWIIAEWLYKFHSFTFECAAFLATWYITDVAMEWIQRRLGRSSGLSYSEPGTGK